MSKALLLIHGFLTGPDDWNELLPYLEPLYDEVVLFKQPGHELKDDKPHFRDFTEPAVYAALDETLKSLEKYDGVDVAGHSMGGAGAVYACAKLKNVRKCLLYAPAFKYPRPDAVFRYGAQTKKLETLKKACDDEALGMALERRLAAVRMTHDASLGIFFKRLLPHWGPRNLLTFMRVMGAAVRYLPEVECPTCVFWGDLDEFIPAASARYVMESIGSREMWFVRYPDDGRAFIYLGNVPRQARDTLAFLEGDLMDVKCDTGEERVCFRTVRGEAGSFVTVSRTECGVHKAGGRAKEYVRSHTDTYNDGGAAFFGSIPAGASAPNADKFI